MCCYDGARPRAYSSCLQRADRVKIGPNCVQAFTECCTMATEIRANDTFKRIHVLRNQCKYGIFCRNLPNLCKLSKRSGFHVLLTIRIERQITCNAQKETLLCIWGTGNRIAHSGNTSSEPRLSGTKASSLCRLEGDWESPVDKMQWLCHITVSKTWNLFQC